MMSLPNPDKYLYMALKLCGGKVTLSREEHVLVDFETSYDFSFPFSSLYVI
jgi:hypothetical protein